MTRSHALAPGEMRVAEAVTPGGPRYDRGTMILRSEEVTQAIAPGTSGRFLKDLIRVDASQPLSIVRKRLPGGARPRAAVLLTHGFGQNRYAWHLSNRSFVNYLASHGYDVFNLDLRGHGRSRAFGAKPAESIDDYLREDLPAALGETQSLSGHSRVFVIGHSLGGLVACAAAAHDARAFLGIVTVATPYRFGRGSASLTFLMRVAELAASAGILHAGPGRFPVRAVGAFMQWYRLAWDARMLPIPLRVWDPGSFEPRALREYLRRSFDQATVGTLVQLARLAVRGEFRSFDDREDYGAGIEALDLPLLVVAGSRDRLAPPASVRPLYDRSHAHDRSYRVFPLGHADLLLGRSAPATSWPAIEAWLAKRVAP